MLLYFLLVVSSLSTCAERDIDRCIQWAPPCQWISGRCLDCTNGCSQKSQSCCEANHCVWIDDSCRYPRVYGACNSTSCSDLNAWNCSWTDCHLAAQGCQQVGFRCVECPQADDVCEKRVSRKCCLASDDCIWTSGACVDVPSSCMHTFACKDYVTPCNEDDCNGARLGHGSCQWDPSRPRMDNCQLCPESKLCSSRLSVNCCTELAHCRWRARRCEVTQ